MDGSGLVGLLGLTLVLCGGGGRQRHINPVLAAGFYMYLEVGKLVVNADFDEGGPPSCNMLPAKVTCGS